MKTIQDYLKEDYSKWYDKPYIYHREGDVFVHNTFGQTIEDIINLAAGLLEAGYKDKKIMVYGENSYEWMIADLAIMGYVGVSAGTDKEWKYNDIHRMAEIIDVAAIIYAPSKTSVISKLKESNPHIEYIRMDTDLYDIIAKGKTINASKDDVFEFEERDYETCAKIVFSSGTTAFPKAVMLSHRNLLCGFDNLYLRAPMDDTDVCYLFLPLHHTYGGICNFFFSIISGISIYICSDTKKIAEELRMVNPTVFSAVPLIVERFYNAAMTMENSEATLKAMYGNRLKYLFSGGAFLKPEIRQFYKSNGLNLMEAYALSETTSILAIEYSYSDNIYNSGTIFENIEVKIDNPDKEGVGEILVKGDNVFLGYCNNEEATNAAFTEEGFFKTGDLGYIKDGDIYLKGRKKRMLLSSNGENIYPDEIEEIILEDSRIKKTRVFMEEGYLIHATMYVDSEDAKPDDEFIEQVNSKLPKYKHIKRWDYVIDSLDKRIK